MPTYMDESGDFGPDAESSDEFHLTAVWFETIDHALACEDLIRSLRAANQWKRDYVFHSADLSPPRRRQFFQAVAGVPFRFAACSVDKQAARTKGYKLTPQSIVDAAASSVASVLAVCYRNAEAVKKSPLKERVKLHHHDNKEYVGWVESQFKAIKSPTWPKVCLVKHLKTERAESEELIQLADMVCGAIRHAFEGNAADYQLIRSKEAGWLNWP